MLFFLVLACVSAAFVGAMIRIGALDHPVARSSHTVPTPKGGGVGIVVAFTLGVGWQVHAHALPATVLVPLAAALFLAAVSYRDDVTPGPVALKFAAQILACGVAIAGGDRLIVATIAGQHLHIATLAGVPLTLAWLLFVTNAVNFIDGLNGLAAGSVAVAGTALALASQPMAVPAIPLLAGIVGFLPFNYPRARIFMGDVGSQFCGLTIGCLAVRAAAGVAPLVLPLALLPILGDVAFTLVRRLIAGAQLTQAHRGHLYQVAHRAGMKTALVAGVYWIIAAWGAGCGMFASAAGNGTAVCLTAVIAALLPMAAWAAIVTMMAARAGFTTW